MRKIIVILLLALVAGYFGWNAYNRAPEEMTERKTDLSFSAENLLLKFTENEAEANAELLDKTIEVQGVISQIDQSEKSKSIYLETSDLMSSVICELESGTDLSALTEGQTVRVKGQCTGFLSDVILVRCILVN